MVKRNVTLSLTHEYVDGLKKRGANISKLVDDHLKEVYGRKFARLPQEELAKINPEFKLILDFGRSHLEYHRQRPEVARQWYKEAAAKLGISVRRLKKLIGG